jgi:tripartite-type tricarboxylate transporter receptor subunit TctC
MNARTLAAMAIGIAVGLAGAAQAQTFPSRTVKIIVPFAPGGAADIMARVLAENMAKGLGQPVIVDNRPGAGAVIGYELVARAPGDGYTVLVVFPSFIINPSIRRGLAYDPIKDFKAVGQTISLPMAIAVNPAVPAKSLQELIALARAKPGELAYGTPGAGTIQHVFGEMLKLAANINIVHVPYQGGGAQVMATVGGHIPMVVSNVTEIAPSATSGKVRALVVTTPERAEALPDVPTVREAGYPGLEATNWAGFVVPAATPPAVIARLNAELVRALHNPEVQEKLKTQGMFPAPGTPEQFATLLQSGSARYAKVVQEAGIKLD